MSENGLFSSTILPCSVALNDVEDNMIDSVKVGMENRVILSAMAVTQHDRCHQLILYCTELPVVEVGFEKREHVLCCC